MKSIDWSKPLQTRQGKKARLLGELIGRSDCMVCAVEAGEGENIHEQTIYSHKTGKYINSATNHSHDIINVPQRIKREAWVNVYPEAAVNESALHNNKENADRYALEHRIACVKVVIDYEEGEGL